MPPTVNPSFADLALRFHERYHTQITLAVALVLALFAGLMLSRAAHAQGAAPTVTLTAQPDAGTSPVSTTLTWSSSGATSCSASGGWSGAKALTGSEVVSGITATTVYTLSCVGATGSARLTWTAPTQRVDNTPLTNLAAYRVYLAQTAAGVASATPRVVYAPASSYDVTGLAAGTWFFGVRAVDSAGLASDLSNVPTKSVTVTPVSASATVTVTPAPPKPPTAVTVSDPLAYSIRKGPSGKEFLGASVGTVSVGVTCGTKARVTTADGDHYVVPRESVALRDPAKVGPFVARCAT